MSEHDGCELGQHVGDLTICVHRDAEGRFHWSFQPETTDPVGMTVALARLVFEVMWQRPDLVFHAFHSCSVGEYVEEATAQIPEEVLGRMRFLAEEDSSEHEAHGKACEEATPGAKARAGDLGMRVFANAHVGDERDYGRDGEVERLVSQFLFGNRTEWFYLTEIAMRFELDRKRLDKVMWRLFRKGTAQTRTDGRGYVQWRGR